MAPALDGLTDAQRDAVTHRGTPLLVIGGPGTGKTEVLVRRVVALADEGLEPHRILVISAQEDLRERIELALERPHEDLAVHSFPELARTLLSLEARHAGIDPFVDVVSSAERLAMLLERADELELSHHDFRGRPLALFASFIRRVDALKAELIDASAYAAWAEQVEDATGEREREFAAVFAAHDRMLEARGVFDEGGVLASAVALLRGDEPVRERTAARFPAVLVDDWQDRCGGERELVAELERSGCELSAAGDDDQALSRGRGAGAANLLRFTRRRPGASVVTLSQSFRCPQRVLDAAHAVVADAGPRIGKDLLGGAGGEVRFWRAANERAQAQRVAAELERLIGREGVAPERCAVLVRSLAEEGQPVAVALTERSVPCRIVGADAFFDRAEVRDVLAWLAAARPARRAGGRARARAPADRAAGRRHRALRPDLAAAADRHGLGAARGDRVAAARPRGTRADLALPRDRADRLAGPREHARRPLRAPPDRAPRAAPPAALHGARRRRRAAPEPRQAR